VKPDAPLAVSVVLDPAQTLPLPVTDMLETGITVKQL
jgi:hypothetical protein